MRVFPRAFTLIEVMLAVAIFAFAVVGFGVALNDVLGVNSEILRTAQRRQAVESVTAQILAVSNNLTQSDWAKLPGWGNEKTWTLEVQTQPVQVGVMAPNNQVETMEGWWRVDVRALDPKGEAVDRIAVLLWRER